MSVIFSSNITLNTQPGDVANRPRILVDNVFQQGTVTASSEVGADNGWLENAVDGGTYDWWEWTSTPAWLEVTLTTAQPADMCAIGLHTGLTFVYQYWNGTAWVNLHDAVTTTSTAVYAAIFSEVTASKYRIYISAADDEKILGIVMLGKSLQFPKTFHGGHAPIVLNRTTQIVRNKTEAGFDAGVYSLRTGAATSVEIDNIKPSWIRDNLEDLNKKLEICPFIFAWRPSTHPNDVAYCWLNSPITASNNGTRDYMTMRFDVQAFVGGGLVAQSCPWNRPSVSLARLNDDYKDLAPLDDDSGNFTWGDTGTLSINGDQPKFGGQTLETTAGYLRSPAGAANNLSVGTGDFTAEIWAYRNTDYASGTIFGLTAGNNNFNVFHVDFVNSSNNRGVWVSGGALFVDYIIESNDNFLLDTWTHIAVTRKNNLLTLWVNGVNSGTYNLPAGLTLSAPITIGASILSSGTALLPFIGHLSQFRLVKGLAVWENNFTPCSIPYDYIPYDPPPPPPPPPFSNATFDPTDIGAGVALSNGDLTCTSTANAFFGAKSTLSISTKTYVETTVSGITNNNILIGITDVNVAGTAITAAGLTYYAQAGGLWKSGLVSGGMGVATNGDVIAVAVDPAAKLIWISINGSWKNGDPSVGTGGYDYSVLIPGANVFICGATYTSGQAITINFGASAFAYPVPTGFNT